MKLKHGYISLIIGTICFLSLPFPAWGAEETTSGVVTCGEQAVSETEDLTLGGPGAADITEQVSDTDTVDAAQTGTKGESLGIFTTTGYCTCTSCCSSGWTLTYSGTVPKANHTISADISLYPIGTRLMIDDVIYTVEDIGGHVEGNWLDIYYDTHDNAVAHGKQEQEVFTVLP